MNNSIDNIIITVNTFHLIKNTIYFTDEVFFENTYISIIYFLETL